MCKMKDVNVGIKKLDFTGHRGKMAVYLTDGRDRRARSHRAAVILPGHQASFRKRARRMDDTGRPVFHIRPSEQGIFGERPDDTGVAA